MPNKIFKKLTGGGSNSSKEYSPRVSDKSKLFTWCKEECAKHGLELDASTLMKEYDVYRGKEVIGRYNTLAEVRAAIKDGSITQDYNL